MRGTVLNRASSSEGLTEGRSLRLLIHKLKRSLKLEYKQKIDKFDDENLKHLVSKKKRKKKVFFDL